MSAPGTAEAAHQHPLPNADCGEAELVAPQVTSTCANTRSRAAAAAAPASARKLQQPAATTTQLQLQQPTPVPRQAALRAPTTTALTATTPDNRPLIAGPSAAMQLDSEHQHLDTAAAASTLPRRRSAIQLEAASEPAGNQAEEAGDAAEEDGDEAGPQGSVTGSVTPGSSSSGPRPAEGGGEVDSKPSGRPRRQTSRKQLGGIVCGAGTRRISSTSRSRSTPCLQRRSSASNRSQQADDHPPASPACEHPTEGLDPHPHDSDAWLGLRREAHTTQCPGPARPQLSFATPASAAAGGGCWLELADRTAQFAAAATPQPPASAAATFTQLPTAARPTLFSSAGLPFPAGSSSAAQQLPSLTGASPVVARLAPSQQQCSARTALHLDHWFPSAHQGRPASLGTDASPAPDGSAAGKRKHLSRACDSLHDHSDPLSDLLQPRDQQQALTKQLLGTSPSGSAAGPSPLGFPPALGPSELEEGLGESGAREALADAAGPWARGFWSSHGREPAEGAAVAGDLLCHESSASLLPPLLEPRRSLPLPQQRGPSSGPGSVAGSAGPSVAGTPLARSSAGDRAVSLLPHHQQLAASLFLGEPSSPSTLPAFPQGDIASALCDAHTAAQAAHHTGLSGRDDFFGRALLKMGHPCLHQAASPLPAAAADPPQDAPWPALLRRQPLAPEPGLLSSALAHRAAAAAAEASHDRPAHPANDDCDANAPSPFAPAESTSRSSCRNQGQAHQGPSGSGAVPQASDWSEVQSESWSGWFAKGYAVPVIGSAEAESLLEKRVLAATPGKQRSDALQSGAARLCLRGLRSSPLASPGALSPHPSGQAAAAGPSSGPMLAPPSQSQLLLLRRAHSASSPLPFTSSAGGLPQQQLSGHPSCGPPPVEGSPSKKVCMDPPSSTLRPALGAGYRQHPQPSTAGGLLAQLNMQTLGFSRGRSSSGGGPAYQPPSPDSLGPRSVSLGRDRLPAADSGIGRTSSLPASRFPGHPPPLIRAPSLPAAFGAHLASTTAPFSEAAAASSPSGRPHPHQADHRRRSSEGDPARPGAAMQAGDYGRPPAASAALPCATQHHQLGSPGPGPIMFDASRALPVLAGSAALAPGAAGARELPCSAAEGAAPAALNNSWLPGSVPAQHTSLPPPCLMTRPDATAAAWLQQPGLLVNGTANPNLIPAGDACPTIVSAVADGLASALRPRLGLAASQPPNHPPDYPHKQAARQPYPPMAPPRVNSAAALAFRVRHISATSSRPLPPAGASADDSA